MAQTDYDVRISHVHDGGAIHNHTHYTTAGTANTRHSHRYTARGAWEGCKCAHCEMVRARRVRLAVDKAV